MKVFSVNQVAWPVLDAAVMNSLTRLLRLALLAPVIAFAQSDAPVDFNKARELFERRSKGETLTSDEQAYIERAKAEHDKQSRDSGADGIDWERAKKLHQRSQAGEKLSAEDEAYYEKAKAARQRGNDGGSANTGSPRNRDQRKAPEHLTPLCDLAGEAKYEGEGGGLYGGGSNQPPEAHRKAAEEALKQIQPLDASGKTSSDGKIVFVSISMSNATMEFSTFKPMADESPLKSPNVVVVDCAQGGQAMAQWVPADGKPWQEAMTRIERAKVTPQQVQVAWVKLANVGPNGSISDHLAKLEADTTKVLQNAKQKFPNLRIAYLGSRIYAGYASTPLNPEPYAYESAFGVRHLIQQQIKGDAELTLTKAPLLLWGPYLWADGKEGRKMDNLKWLPEDFGRDGTHPSDSGRNKVAKLLLDFVTTDPLAKSWFVKR